MDVKNSMVEHVSHSIFYNSYVDTNSSALFKQCLPLSKSCPHNQESAGDWMTQKIQDA